MSNNEKFKKCRDFNGDDAPKEVTMSEAKFIIGLFLVIFMVAACNDQTLDWLLYEAFGG